MRLSASVKESASERQEAKLSESVVHIRARLGNSRTIVIARSIRVVMSLIRRICMRVPFIIVSSMCCGNRLIVIIRLFLVYLF